MSELKHQIIQQLPYLRRYARALTGSQQTGDQQIRFCLEALLQAPERLKGGSLPVQLFRLFHQTVDKPVAAAAGTAGAGKGGAADLMERRVGERLAQLAPSDRQALLLVHQEGFSQAEAAEILGLDAAEIAQRLDHAWSNLKRQPATDVLIIEDEPVIAMDVAEIVKSLGHRVIGIAARASQAVATAREAKPGLILADIQLEDGSSGITAVQTILTAAEVPVVFVTAFPERLLTGETLEPAFVVTKPFDAAALKVAISQALFFSSKA
ncbi:MAG TPA: response regulator [Verrucomicrobiae bacterium]|jgi:CheY-like chemotaxis protein/DNA-directed RNA polymerase specialized sigma24 family protein|nr:response regulator [Verrucomicrobiae bacterium]